MSDQIWFRSTLFDGHEDAEPRRLGGDLAAWLATALRGDGLPVDEVLQEDWGWCVLVRKAPFRLWVGCGAVEGTHPAPPARLTVRDDVVWTCFVAAEVPWLKRRLSPTDTASDVAALFERVKRLVATAPGQVLFDEP